MLGFAPLASSPLADDGAVSSIQHVLPADAGVFALAVQDVSLPKGYTLTSDSGSFSLTEQEISFVVASVTQADVGIFTLAGQDASLSRGYLLTSDTG